MSNRIKDLISMLDEVKVTYEVVDGRLIAKDDFKQGTPIRPIKTDVTDFTDEELYIWL